MTAHSALEMSCPDGAYYGPRKSSRQPDSAGLTPTRRALNHKSWSLRSSKERREENQGFVRAEGYNERDQQSDPQCNCNKLVRKHLDPSSTLSLAGEQVYCSCTGGRIADLAR